MLTDVLQRRQEALLEQERALANELRDCFHGFRGAKESAQELQKIINLFDELFCLAVMGEFNVGKSALINAFVRDCVLKEDIIQATYQVTKLCYGEQVVKETIDQDNIKIFHPSLFLRNICIVDTPGGNAVIRKHEYLAKEFIPKSDLILFVTWAKKALPQTEIDFLKSILFWNREVIIIINGIDELRPSEKLETVVDKVTKNCNELLGFQPMIFPVSALNAQKGQIRYPCNGDENEKVKSWEAEKLWEESKFPDLLTYLTSRLGEVERVRGKLQSPLGSLRRLVTQSQKAVNRFGESLEQDAYTIDLMRYRLEFYSKNIKGDLLNRFSKIDTIIQQMIIDGTNFFDETISPGSFRQVMQPEEVKYKFKRDVIGDSEKKIDEAVHDLITWYVDQVDKLWGDILEYVERRQQVSAHINYDDLINMVDPSFVANRRKQLQELAQNTKEIVRSSKPEEEAQQVTAHLSKTIAGTISSGIGALGTLGGGVALALLGAATAGIGSLVVGLGLSIVALSIIPGQRNRAKKHFQEQMAKLQKDLHDCLEDQFNTELNETINQAMKLIKPYENIISDEKNKKASINSRLLDISEKMDILTNEIGNLK